MGLHKPREHRKAVFVTCRLRDDNGWSDTTICNVSPHGLMAQCNDPPARGAFVEIRKGGVTIVGQVRWARNDRIGVRTQDAIDVGSLLNKPPAASDEAAAQDRRSPARGRIAPPPRPAAADLAEQSRRWSQLFDWLVVAAIGIGSAAVLAAQVHSMMAAPLESASAAMGRD